MSSKGHIPSSTHDYYEAPQEEQAPASDFDPMANDRIEGDPSYEIPEMEEGETIQLPEVTASGMVDSLGDRIYAGFGSVSGISRDSKIAIGPNDFGITYEGKYPTKATLTKGPGYYTAMITMEIISKYNVRDSLGPVNQINISNERDAGIHSENYSKVVRDLTPSKAETPPPRHWYWSRPIVLRHERFHAREYVTQAFLGVDLARNWLARQQVSNENDAFDRISAVPKLVASKVKNLSPGAEDRAYADGFQSYIDLSNKIRFIGNSGGYR